MGLASHASSTMLQAKPRTPSCRDDAPKKDGGGRKRRKGEELKVLYFTSKENEEGERKKVSSGMGT